MADELNEQTETETEAASTTAATATETTAKATDAAPGKTTETVAKPADGKTIATGADAEVDDKAKDEAAAKTAKPYWPEDWRQKHAEHVAAGDKKALARELKRLERIADPSGLYGMYRELEAKFTGGGLVKVPGKDAKPEELEAYHKALGVPEKPDDYFKDVKLENGAVIGEADKPVLNEVAGVLHKAGAPPTVANAIVNWYYQRQEQQAAQMDEADDTFRRESEKALKEELGPAFKRQTNGIASIFASAPGGADVKNPNSLYARLMGGRTADGRVIGNDPDMVRFLISVAQDINPAATVVEDGAGTIKTVEQELGDIQKLRSTEPKKYWSADVQARELELIAARNKIQERQRA